MATRDGPGHGAADNPPGGDDTPRRGDGNNCCDFNPTNTRVPENNLTHQRATKTLSLCSHQHTTPENQFTLLRQRMFPVGGVQCRRPASAVRHRKNTTGYSLIFVGFLRVYSWILVSPSSVTRRRPLGRSPGRSTRRSFLLAALGRLRQSPAAAARSVDRAPLRL